LLGIHTPALANAFHFTLTFHDQLQSPTYPAQSGFFPFRPKDGGQPAPNSPTYSGSVQFSMEQLQQLMAYAQTCMPDEYGKVRVSASLWETTSINGLTYLKGNAKQPMLPAPAPAPAPTQPPASAPAPPTQWQQQPAPPPASTQWQQPYPPAVTTDQAYQAQSPMPPMQPPSQPGASGAPYARPPHPLSWTRRCSKAGWPLSFPVTLP